jgi:ankyrin repeat protein
MEISIDQLSSAIHHGDVKTVYEYIKNEGNLEELTIIGLTPLILASMCGKNFIGLLLLQAGANSKVEVHNYGDYYTTCLDFVSGNNKNTGIFVDQLIKHNCLNSDATDKENILQNSLDYGNLQATKRLIVEGIQMNECLWKYAHETGNKSSYNYKSEQFVDELKLFVDNMTDQTIIDVKSQYDYDLTNVINDVLNIIGLTNKQIYDEPNKTMRDKIVQELVQEVRNDEQKELKYSEKLSDDELLAHKASNGDLVGVKLILSSHKYSEKGLFDAINSAVNTNQLNVVKLLLTNKININKGFSPLFSAVMHNKIEMVQTLIEAGADPNYMFKNDTALSEAVYYNYNDDTIPNFLISKGSDINVAIELLEAFGPSDEVQEESKIKGLSMLYGLPVVADVRVCSKSRQG